MGNHNKRAMALVTYGDGTNTKAISCKLPAKPILQNDRATSLPPLITKLLSIDWQAL